MLPTSARHRRSLLRFARAREGAAAVEFAFVAIPFLTLLFAIIELGLVFLASNTLDTATARAARDIRTGRTTEVGATTAAGFADHVCARMSWLQSRCEGGALFVDVRTYDSFADMAGEDGRDPGTFDPDESCWNLGTAGDIVLVRTYFTWPLFTPLLDTALANTADGRSRLITSASAFRNEPFNDDDPEGAGC